MLFPLAPLSNGLEHSARASLRYRWPFLRATVLAGRGFQTVIDFSIGPWLVIIINTDRQIVDFTFMHTHTHAHSYICSSAPYFRIQAQTSDPDRRGT